MLVEIRPEALAKDHLEDGPFEMSLVVVQARRRRAVVAGIDWYRDEDIGRSLPGDPAAEKAYEAELGELEEKVSSFDAYEALQAPARTQDFLTVLDGRSRASSSPGAPASNACCVDEMRFR